MAQCSQRGTIPLATATHPPDCESRQSREQFPTAVVPLHPMLGFALNLRLGCCSWLTDSSKMFVGSVYMPRCLTLRTAEQKIDVWVNIFDKVLSKSWNVCMGFNVFYFQISLDFFTEVMPYKYKHRECHNLPRVKLKGKIYTRKRKIEWVVKRKHETRELEQQTTQILSNT